MRYLATAFLISISCLACLDKESDNKAGKTKTVRILEHAPAEVVVSEVKTGPIYKIYTSVGNVTPKDTSRIFPKVGGKISEVFVEEGDLVKKGQLLLQIDTFDYTRVVENATAVMNQAGSNLDKANRDYDRIEKLYSDKAVSKQQLQDMKTALDLARFAYDQALTALKKANDDLKECGVRAPIDGMVTTKMVNPGELTSPQAMVFVIMQMGTVEIEVNLPEEAFGYVREGENAFASFDAIPDTAMKGVITKMYPTIDPLSRTIKIVITVDNPNLEIRSGMTARTKIIEIARENSIFAPKAALIPVEDQYICYRINSGKVEKTTVDVGIIGDEVFEVKKGLALGDKVVVQGVTGLRDGMSVKVVPLNPKGNP
jgi:RND family efflux transporter MFP subunit